MMVYVDFFSGFNQPNSLQTCALSNNPNRPRNRMQVRSALETFQENLDGPCYFFMCFFANNQYRNPCGREQQWHWQSGRGVRNKSREDWQNGCDAGHLGSTQIVDPTDWVKQLGSILLVVGSFWLKGWMALRCNRCGQEEPHLGDSWCLACSAAEAISGELRSAWGSPGSRSLASDVLVAATRHIRALRRLGIAGAGRGRPSVPEGAVPGRAPSAPPAIKPESRATSAQPSEPPPPPPRVPERAPSREREVRSKDQERVKREPPSREASEDFSEGEESDTRVEGPRSPSRSVRPQGSSQERSQVSDAISHSQAPYSRALGRWSRQRCWRGTCISSRVQGRASRTSRASTSRTSQWQEATLQISPTGPRWGEAQEEEEETGQDIAGEPNINGFTVQQTIHSRGSITRNLTSSGTQDLSSAERINGDRKRVEGRSGRRRDERGGSASCCYRHYGRRRGYFRHRAVCFVQSQGWAGAGSLLGRQFRRCCTTRKNGLPWVSWRLLEAHQPVGGLSETIWGARTETLPKKSWALCKRGSSTFAARTLVPLLSTPPCIHATRVRLWRGTKFKCGYLMRGAASALKAMALEERAAVARVSQKSQPPGQKRPGTGRTKPAGKGRGTTARAPRKRPAAAADEGVIPIPSDGEAAEGDAGLDATQGAGVRRAALRERLQLTKEKNTWGGHTSESLKTRRGFDWWSNTCSYRTCSGVVSIGSRHILEAGEADPLDARAVGGF